MADERCGDCRWDQIEREIRVRADQLIYARQREWSNLFTFDRLKLRNLIADLAIEEARVAVRRFEGAGCPCFERREGE